jgi:hypothetical protein
MNPDIIGTLVEFKMGNISIEEAHDRINNNNSLKLTIDKFLNTDISSIYLLGKRSIRDYKKLFSIILRLEDDMPELRIEPIEYQIFAYEFQRMLIPNPAYREMINNGDSFFKLGFKDYDDDTIIKICENYVKLTLKEYEKVDTNEISHMSVLMNILGFIFDDGDGFENAFLYLIKKINSFQFGTQFNISDILSFDLNWKHLFHNYMVDFTKIGFMVNNPIGIYTKQYNIPENLYFTDLDTDEKIIKLRRKLKLEEILEY